MRGQPSRGSISTSARVSSFIDGVSAEAPKATYESSQTPSSHEPTV